IATRRRRAALDAAAQLVHDVTKGLHASTAVAALRKAQLGACRRRRAARARAAVRIGRARALAARRAGALRGAGRGVDVAPDLATVVARFWDALAARRADCALAALAAGGAGLIAAIRRLAL